MVGRETVESDSPKATVPRIETSVLQKRRQNTCMDGTEDGGGRRLRKCAHG